jgi:hypothetical protein
VHGVEAAFLGHRAERRARQSRVRREALARLGHERFEERPMDALVDVDALDRATALPGIVQGAVCDLRGRIRDVCIGADVGGVFAAELRGRRQ